jgi:hypothetical protein
VRTRLSGRNSLLSGKIQGIARFCGIRARSATLERRASAGFEIKFPTLPNREFLSCISERILRSREWLRRIRETSTRCVPPRATGEDSHRTQSSGPSKRCVRCAGETLRDQPNPIRSPCDRAVMPGLGIAWTSLQSYSPDGINFWANNKGVAKAL